MTLNDIHIMTQQKSCIILCTTNSYKNAMEITQFLLNNHLAACVSLLPKITCLYLYKKNIIKNKGILLLINILQKNQIKLVEVIKEIHSYKVPELIRLDSSQIKENHLQWLINSAR